MTSRNISEKRNESKDLKVIYFGNALSEFSVSFLKELNDLDISVILVLSSSSNIVSRK